MSAGVDSDLLNSILDSARIKAILFGLCNHKLAEHTLKRNVYGAFTYCVTSRITPNRYGWLHTLYINNDKAGTIVSLQISDTMYHMVGMFIREPYRRSKFFAEQVNPESDFDLPNPSEYLMEALVNDVLAHDRQMTLEVMNNNRGACELYDRQYLINNQPTGFLMMTKPEIASYAAFRNKKIGKWHLVESGEAGERWGAQWSHIPDYNNSSRWSINRVYLLSLNGRRFSLQKTFIHSMQMRWKALLTLLRYGNIGAGLSAILKR